MNERVYFTTKKRRRILKKKKKKKKKKSVRFERERESGLFVCFVGDLLFPLASSARSSRGLFLLLLLLLLLLRHRGDGFR